MNCEFSYSAKSGQKSKQGVPDIPVTSDAFQFLFVYPQVFPGQMVYIVPPAGSGSATGSFPSWMCPENLSREVIPGGCSLLRASPRCPSSSTLSSANLWRNLTPAACFHKKSHPFSQYPKQLMLPIITFVITVRILLVFLQHHHQVKISVSSTPINDSVSANVTTLPSASLYASQSWLWWSIITRSCCHHITSCFETCEMIF